MSKSMQEIWEISVAAWSETDSKKQRTLLQQAFSESIQVASQTKKPGRAKSGALVR